MCARVRYAPPVTKAPKMEEFKSRYNAIMLITLYLLTFACFMHEYLLCSWHIMLNSLKTFVKCGPFLRHHQLLLVRTITISQTAAGVTVATFPEPGLTAGLSVIVGGGSRYETDKTAGAARYLKNYTFMVKTLCHHINTHQFHLLIFIRVAE